MCLKNQDSAEENSVTNIWMTCPWVTYHLLQKIAVVKDHEGSKDPAPEEEKAHAQVKHGVQVFSSPYLPYKSAVCENINCD